MKLLLFSVVLLLLNSCSVIKPYETQYIKDPEMQMGQDASQQFSDYIHSIREGSVPAGGVKSIGGCGCN